LRIDWNATGLERNRPGCSSAREMRSSRRVRTASDSDRIKKDQSSGSIARKTWDGLGAT